MTDDIVVHLIGRGSGRGGEGREMDQKRLSIIDDPKFKPGVAPVCVHNEMAMAAVPERAWATLIRAADWPIWYPNSKDVRIDDGGADLHANAEFSWETFGVHLRSAVRVFEPPARLAWTAEGIGVDAYHAWLIVPAASGCRVITEETQYGWLARAANWLMPARMHRGHQLWLERLASRCEGR